MTDRLEILRQVEEMLGPEGTPEQAQALLPILERHGHVTFDPTYGYALTMPDWDDCGELNALIAESQESL